MQWWHDLSGDIRKFLIVITALDLAGVLLYLALSNTARLEWSLLGTALVYVFCVFLIRGKNWARITLVILTFPVGLMLLSPEARSWCAGKSR